MVTEYKNGNHRKPSVDLSTMVYCKVPPQALELEEAVLGAIMLEKDALERVDHLLKPESFYTDVHQRIYKAMLSLKRKNIQVDILMVIEELKRNEDLEFIGGPYYLIKIQRDVVSTANLIPHAEVIKEKFEQRELIRVAGEILAEAYNDTCNVKDLFDRTQNSISKIIVEQTSKPYKSLLEVSEKALMFIEERRHQKEGIPGVPSGIKKLDDITLGWQPSDLIIIAARPSVGKSAVAANIARNAAFDPYKQTKVGMFLLEMKDTQYVINMLSAQSYIEKSLMKTGKIDDQQMRKIESVVYKQFSNSDIFFDDSSSLNIYQLKAKARRMVLKDGVGLIIIDYMQLMSGDRDRNENREQEVSKISRELKQLAKELNVPIIALSQLSRKGEGEPTLSTLRESGAIEQDADIVIFLIPVTEDMVREDASLKDSILIKIAKQRDGALDKIPLKFVKEIQKIMSESEYDDYISGKHSLISMSTAIKQTRNFYGTDKPFDEGFNETGV